MSLFEDFQGDYDQLAAAMEASWANSAAPPFLYTAEFLADCFSYPGADFSLAPATYDESGLVAFVAGFPRRIRVQGAERRVLIVAFLTAAARHQGRGYGILAWSELLRRAADAGFDGVVNYCVEGDVMNRMIEGSCRRLGLPVFPVSSFSYLSRVLWPRRFEHHRPQRHVSPEALVTSAARLSTEPTALTRLWSKAEAAWQLARVGGICVTAGPASDPAILTGYVLPVADRRQTKCLVVEDVLWGGLGSDERPGLIGDLIARGTAAGARLAILPRLTYADLQPFLASGFRPSQRTIHAYLTLWAGSMPKTPATSYYLDVF